MQQLLHKNLFFLPSDRANIKTNQVCYAIVDRHYLTTAYMELTGRFPKQYSSGNQHVLVGYHYDANYTHENTHEK